VATTPQRAYRAACPNCGAPVEFASAASASAVCSFCRSTLVRDGEALRRIGASAEVFDDHTPLQLGASGRYQGEAFTLVGRLQNQYAEGTWNEWHALFDNGRSGWLSEDNGAYVFAFELPLQGTAPPPDELVPGERRLVHGAAWSVASVTRATLIAAQGELPRTPRLDGGEFVVADLRNERNEVGTLDYGESGPPGWSIGRPVRLAELQMTGLRDEPSEKTLGGRGFACPSCGTALELKLSTTQSIACPQCKAVVDVSQGIGGDLAHYGQNNSGHDGTEPQIPLGKTGRLALTPGGERDWQVVGYQERCDLPEDGDEDEQTFWREYLLYHRSEGFVFLVDTEDGWSWVRPLTGAPQVRGDTAQWQGRSYRKQWRYRAKTTWVLGEFYWRVHRDEVVTVTDYIGAGPAADRRLSSEQTESELTWSEGATLPERAIAQAFGLGGAAEAALKRRSPATGVMVDSGLAKVALIIAVVAIVLAVGFCSSSESDCADVRATFGEASNEYRQCLATARTRVRTGGGSFGGYSSGGGHK
jgi:DNA-directed RNA polymerase subunit RPC12/RpoP